MIAGPADDWVALTAGCDAADLKAAIAAGGLRALLYRPDGRPRLFRHFRNRQLYQVVDEGLDTVTEQPIVVYRALYPTAHSLFSRPAAEFYGTVEGGALRFEPVTGNGEGA